MTEQMTANIHRAENGVGYKIKYPSAGPYDSWALTLRGAHRRSKRMMRRYYRRRHRRDNAVSVVAQVKIER